MKKTETISPTPALRPSMLSSRLNVLVMPTIQTTVRMPQTIGLEMKRVMVCPSPATRPTATSVCTARRNQGERP